MNPNIPNPQAFPQPMAENQGRMDFADEYGNGGMTLRDYFAGKCLQAQISMEGMEGCDKDHIAAMSYEMADAMLAERNKKQ